MDAEHIDHAEILHSWEFPEYEKHHRGRWWYVLFGGIAAAFLVYAVFSDNYIFGVLVLLTALVYFLFDLHDAPTVRFSITTGGVAFNKKFFRYRDLENFWIVYRPGEVTKLYFKPKVLTFGSLAAPLLEEDPLHVRELLLQYLPENPHEEDEPLSDAIGRALKL